MKVFFTFHVSRFIDSLAPAPDHAFMGEIIYPRSPREMMCGWTHLPRFIDKIRLHLAGKLAPDYQPNFCKGFDGLWLEAAGVKAEEFIEVVKKSITDGEICDWVNKNVKKPESAKTSAKVCSMTPSSRASVGRMSRKPRGGPIGPCCCIYRCETSRN